MRVDSIRHGKQSSLDDRLVDFNGTSLHITVQERCYRTPATAQPPHSTLLATEPAADPTLRLCGLVFHRLIKLVDGTVELRSSPRSYVFSFGFGVGEFGLGVSRL